MRVKARILLVTARGLNPSVCPVSRDVLLISEACGWQHTAALKMVVHEGAVPLARPGAVCLSLLLLI